MLIGISIVKRVTFRGQPQEFANVYHYVVGGTPSAADVGVLIGNIVTIEKDLHSTDVTYVRASGWSAGGSPSQNQMLAEPNLTGTGSQAVNSSMDRERAVLIQWPAGVNVRGRPVFLRKWYHSCGNCATHIFVAGELQNTAVIPPADRTIIENKANLLRTPTIPSSTTNLAAASGREHVSAGICYNWLEHHQLGDAWR